jgi:cellobiose phosphorylase
MDHEFMESALVPQVMLYGFLGFKPDADGCELNPRLPKDWPSLTITRIHIHDHVLDITAHQDGRMEIKTRHAGKCSLRVRHGGRTITLEPSVKTNTP